MISNSYISNHLVTKILEKSEFRRIQSRLRHWFLYLSTIVCVFLATLFIIEKFNKKKNVLTLPYMRNVFFDINKEMERILLLETREEQNVEFLNMSKIKSLLKPLRMTLTTAVFKCIKTNPVLILKRIIKNPGNNLNEDKMSMELVSPYILKTIKAFRTTHYKDFANAKETLIWIFTEYMDIKLSQRVVKGDEFMIRNIMEDALRGLVYMHSKSIAHLDLKIGNIMGKTKKDGSIIYKLIDFGYSQNVGEKGFLIIPGKNYGTYPYKPPEVVFQNKHGLKSDIWSLGAVAWFLSLQFTPFYYDNQVKDMQAYKKFLINKKNSKDKDHHSFMFDKDTSPNLQDFIRVCMNVNYDKRPTAKELLLHPFITQTELSYNISSND